jgi:hypothetical protein
VRQGDDVGAKKTWSTASPPHRSVRARHVYGSYHGSMAAKLLAAHSPFPGACSSRSVSGACGIERCSPRPVPFPPQPPQKVSLPCSAGSQVLRLSPTSPARACPPFGLWPSRTGLDRQTKACWRSPGSRACCFLACAGSQTTQYLTIHSRNNVVVVLPSSSRNGVGILFHRLFEA